MTEKHATLEDTVYFHFAANDTSGSGGDGASPAAHVREAGATITDAPLESPTPALISHASFPAGCYEVAVAATAANGFALNGTYAVFCTLAIDSQNPTGYIGSVVLDNFKASIGAMVPGAAEAGTLSVTQMSSSVVEATDTHFIGRVIIWLDGPLAFQGAAITGYTGVGGIFTFATVTDIPVAGNKFIIV